MGKQPGETGPGHMRLCKHVDDRCIGVSLPLRLFTKVALDRPLCERVCLHVAGYAWPGTAQPF